MKKNTPAPGRIEAKSRETEGDENGDKAGPSPDEENLLVRNVLLWHAVSLIHGWFDKEEKSGLTRPERDRLAERLKKVMEIDPEMPDPKLIQGLIDYFFFRDTLREESLDMLEKSHTLVPEADLIFKRERKLDELQKNSVDTLFRGRQELYGQQKRST